MIDSPNVNFIYIAQKGIKALYDCSSWKSLLVNIALVVENKMMWHLSIIRPKSSTQQMTLLHRPWKVAADFGLHPQGKRLADLIVTPVSSYRFTLFSGKCYLFTTASWFFESPGCGSSTYHVIRMTSPRSVLPAHSFTLVWFTNNTALILPPEADQCRSKYHKLGFGLHEGYR